MRPSARVCAVSPGGVQQRPGQAPLARPCPAAGPDSPVAPVKELTHAVRKQQRALEERLEACLQELRRLCLREAVRLGPGAHARGVNPRRRSRVLGCRCRGVGAPA